MLGCQGLRYYTVNYTCAPNTSRRVASAPSLTACMVAQTSSRTHIIPGGFYQCKKYNYQLTLEGLHYQTLEPTIHL